MAVATGYEQWCPNMEEKAMASHSSILAWKILWMEEPGRLQSMRSLRVRHDWSDLAAADLTRGDVLYFSHSLPLSPTFSHSQYKTRNHYCLSFDTWLTRLLLPAWLRCVLELAVSGIFSSNSFTESRGSLCSKSGERDEERMISWTNEKLWKFFSFPISSILLKTRGGKRQAWRLNTVLLTP